MGFFDRYKGFKVNNAYVSVPFIKIPETATDKKIVYKQGITRFDKLSQKYYGNPFYDWLIKLANPQFGGLEFDIPDKTVIRIPFPLEASLQVYNLAVDTYNKT